MDAEDEDEVLQNDEEDGDATGSATSMWFLPQPACRMADGVDRADEQ
jgi:hypothetical protein